MSRPHYKYHHSYTGDYAAFVIVVLLAGAILAHKSFITKVLSYVLLASLISGTIFVAAVIYKLNNPENSTDILFKDITARYLRIVFLVTVSCLIIGG